MQSLKRVKMIDAINCICKPFIYIKMCWKLMPFSLATNIPPTPLGTKFFQLQN